MNNNIPLEYNINSPPLPASKQRSGSLEKQATFQARATTLVKKLGLLTNRFKPSSSVSVSDSKPTHPYGGLDCDDSHSMPFMGATNKPYISSPLLTINCDYKTQPLARHSVDIIARTNNGNMRGHGHAKEATFGSGVIAQGLAVAALVAEAGLRQPEVSISSQPSTVMQSSSEVPQNKSLLSQDAKTNGSTTSEMQHKKPFNAEGGVNSSGRSTTTDGIPRISTSAASDVSSASQLSISAKRPALRLSTLPPNTFIQKGMSAEQKLSRLSPSVRIRPPPFPILELPALPTPTAESSRIDSTPSVQSPRRGVARLNSMPMLPMQGADARENDPDHEHYGLDEDEEEEVEDSEDIEESANLGSDDDDEDIMSGGRPSTSSQNSVYARMSRTRAPRLPEVLTTPNITFSSLFSSASLSGSIGQGSNPADADAATPKVTSKGANGNGTSTHSDYFSSFQSEHTKDSKVDPYISESHFSQLPSNSPSNVQLTPVARDLPPLPLPIISIAVAPPSDRGPLSGHLQAGSFQAGIRNGPSRRPGMNHQASKSMIELFTPSLLDVKGKGKETEMGEDSGLTILRSGVNNNTDTAQKYADSKFDAKRDMGSETDASEASHTESKDKHSYTAYVKAHGSLEPHLASPTLRRQSSMPTFSTSGPPPPYPSLQLPHHIKLSPPTPREDEGREVLPPYSNAIKLSAVLPRKMEFSAPGKPARDRKWRRVHVVLEGTMLKVYDVKARGTIGHWWEKHVGVGDVSQDSGIGGSQGGTAVAITAGGSVSTTNVIIGSREPRRRMKWEEDLMAEEARRSSAASGSGMREAECEGLVIQTADGEVRSESPSRPQTRTKRIAASFPFLHPNRSRLSISTAPSSPRGSLQIPRSSCERDRRPSADWASTDHGLRASSEVNRSGNGDYSSRSSFSISAVSSTSNSRVSSPDHSRSESVQSNLLNTSVNRSSSRGHSRSQSQPLNLSSSSTNSELKNSSTQSSINSSSETPELDAKDLLRVYTLQRAESGLASDYTKRKNVVRVRLEGEQFLLQCTDVPSVVEWIEGLQSATNIALDLDERPMPKGPIFPRRRRRRRPQATTSAANNASASAPADHSTTEGGAGTSS